MPGLTQTLAAYIAEPNFGISHDRACAIAKIGMIDSVATSFAGSSEPVVRILLEHFSRAGSEGNSVPVPFLDQYFSGSQAATLMGVAAHALDYDDVALSGHPSTVLMPAILVQGHILSSSGIEALRAYVVGYEVWSELISRERDPYHLKGWHPTSVLGTVAATAALAYLHKLPQDVAAHALGISASMATGLVANFGTMTKPLHAGRAAAASLEAIDLAKCGLTAAPDALEHHAGFLRAISPAGNVDTQTSAALDGSPRIVQSGLNIKRYPVCYSSHRVIDAVLEIVQRENLTASQVERVIATIGKPQASMLRNHHPRSGLEAKFSLEFAVASALVARKVGLEQLTDAFVQRDEVSSLFEIIESRISEDPCPLDSAFARNDRVVIHLKDGRKFDSGDIRFPKGHANFPMDEIELRAKFDECLAVFAADAGNPAVSSDVLYSNLLRLEKLPSLRDLFGMAQ